MTEDASAGRLYADVIADTTGFRKDAEKKLKTALAGLKAKAKVEVQYSRIQARAALNATLRDVARDEKLNAVKAPVTFDANQVRRALNKALREAAKLENPPTVKIRVQVDDAQARRQLDRLSRNKKVTVDTRANTKGAEDDVDKARRRLKASPLELALRVPAKALSSIGSITASLTRFPAIASGIMVAAGAVANLTGGLFAMAASASQAVGVLAAIPNAIGVAAQGIGALLLGFSGISDAVKAMTKAQAGAGAAATKSAGQQTAAAQAVRDAQERVARAQQDAAERVAQARQDLARTVEAAAERQAEAERRVADTQADGARRIIDAQQRVADAHRDVQRAVDDLKQATEDATERAQDLALQLSGAALDEEGAVLAVERAKKRLDEMNQPGAVVSSLDKREADLAYRQALQRLAEIRESNEDLAKEKADLDRTGIDGSAEVVAAQERVTEAVRAEAEARADLARTQQQVARDIADAQYELAKTQRDNARDIADAQREVVKAQRDGARAVADAQKALARAMAAPKTAAGQTTAAVTALNAAMANLSPAGQKFARFVKDILQPRFKQLRFAVQEALLPPLQEAATKALPLLDVVQKGLVGTSRVIGRLALDLATVFASPAFQKDIGSIMSSNNRALGNFGKAGIALIKILVRVAEVAGPTLLEPFAKWVRKLAEAAEKSDKLSKSRIAGFLKRAADSAKTLGGIIADVAVAIYNLGRAARPSGDTMLTSLADAADRLRKWTEKPENIRRVQEFFEKTVPLMDKAGGFLKRVADLFLRLGEITGGDTLNGLFWILDKILDVLEGIANLPGGGAILTTLLTLAGVGLGLGLVAKALGGILGNVAKLAKYSGVSKLFDKLGKLGKDADGKTTKTGKGPLGKLADEADDMGAAIDRELPKDKKKSAAVKDIGDKADTTKRKTGDLGKGVDDLGDKADKNSKKSRGLSRAITTIGKRADTAKSKIGSLFGKIGEKTKGKGGAVAAGAGSAAAIAAMLFGPEIMEALGVDPKSVGGQAASGAITGGSIGSIFGPIGTGLGALFGGALGTVKGGGGDVKGASIGSFLGLPGLFAGGFHEKIMGGLKQLAVDVQPQVGKIKDVFANLKTFVPNTLTQAWVLANQTVPGLGQIPKSVGPIISRAKDVFANLKTQAPAILRGAWDFAVKTVPGLQPLVGSVSGIVSSVGAKFSEIRQRAPEILSNAWTTIKTNAGTALGVARDTISNRLSQVGDAFSTLKTNATSRLSTAWESIKTNAGTAFNTIRSTISTKLGQVGDAFSTLKTNATTRIRETMSDVGSRLSTGLTNAKTTVSSILGRIGDAFESAKNNVGRLWAGVQDKAAAPIRWIGTNVYNKGIKGIWDRVAGLVKMSPLPAFPGFAAGGVFPGYTPGRDIGLAAVSGGEAIMRPEWTRAVGPDFVHMMNRLARTGGVRAIRAAMGSAMGAYARGGIIPFAGGYDNGGVVGFLGGLLSVFAGKAKTGFAEGLKSAADAVLKPLLGAVGSAIGGSRWGDMLTKVPPMVVNAFIDFLAKTIEPKLGGDAAGVVAAAKKYIGRGDYTDGFSGANNNIFNRKWGFGAGTPWCANFVSTAISDAKAGKKYPGYPTAAVYGYYSRMNKVGGDAARPGDLGVWGGPTTHINLIEKNLGLGTFQTIGGNENSVVRRSTRRGAYAVLRPKFALGGIVNNRVFREKNLGYDHDKKDPLYRLLSRLSPSVAGRVSAALAQAEWMQRDTGGPLYPGANVVMNDTGGLEWVLTPEAVRMLGGPGAVQALNDRARVSAAGRHASATATARTAPAGPPNATVNVFPQKGQTEYEIGMVAVRKVGTMLRHI